MKSLLALAIFLLSATSAASAASATSATSPWMPDPVTLEKVFVNTSKAFYVDDVGYDLGDAENVVFLFHESGVAAKRLAAEKSLIRKSENVRRKKTKSGLHIATTIFSHFCKFSAFSSKTNECYDQIDSSLVKNTNNVAN
jgi:hypothetical protein